MRTVFTHWNAAGQYGPHGELFFFLKKEPMVLSELVELMPCISAETVKACALIGLHMMAEENALRSNTDFSPEGDMWRFDCPKSPVWSSNGVEWAGSEDASSLEYDEHNVGNLAVEVVGQNWSSEVISLFVEDWEVGRVALSCRLSMDLLCQEMMDTCKGSSGSLGSPSFTVFRVLGRKEEVF